MWNEKSGHHVVEVKAFVDAFSQTQSVGRRIRGTGPPRSFVLGHNFSIRAWLSGMVKYFVLLVALMCFNVFERFLVLIFRTHESVSSL